MLNKNIDLNNLSNIEIFNKTISYKSDDKMRIWLSDNFNRCSMTFDTGSNCINVETVAIDDLDYSNSFNFVRMDIEGYEVFAISEMQKTLKNVEVELVNSQTLELYEKVLNNLD